QIRSVTMLLTAVSEVLGPDPTVCGAGRNEEVFDCAGFLARVDGDLSFARTLVEMFLEDSPAPLATMATALRTGEAVQLQLAAHSLRGMVANFDARGAQELARRLEEMGRCGDLTEAPEVHAALVAMVARLRTSLVELV